MTLNKCSGVQEAPVLNILSSIVRMDQGERECEKHSEPQWPNKHTELLMFVIRIRNHGTIREGVLTFMDERAEFGRAQRHWEVKKRFSG